jgi:hypothetical protein
LNFGQAIELLRQAKSGKRAGWNQGCCIYSSSQYPAITGVTKEYWEKETLYLIAHIGLLKLLKEDVATWAPSGSDSR